MKKHIVEILDEISENPKLIEQYKNNAALKVFFEYAFLPEKKFILPEGNPPYKEDSAPFTMSPTTLLFELKRLYVFLREDLKPIKREQLFINLLESLHPSEAKIILAVKEQKLPKLYKKITRKLVSDAGFIPPLPKKEPKVKKEEEIVQES
jgi:hypothetical protein